MKIHYIQHVEFEGIGSMEKWANNNGHHLSSTKLQNGEILPEITAFDLLIVMGGPMGIFDYTDYPWLKDEKQFIKSVIDADKPVLGVCLGAQLIADVLGAKVYAGHQKEIGWFKIQKDAELKSSPLDKILPEEMTVFHWHGDTFELPENAQPLASSKACQNQGFIYNDKVVALQFHLESTPESVHAIVENCGAELIDSTYIQSKEEIINESSYFESMNQTISDILDYLQNNTQNK